MDRPLWKKYAALLVIFPATAMLGVLLMLGAVAGVLWSCLSSGWNMGRQKWEDFADWVLTFSGQ